MKKLFQPWSATVGLGRVGDLLRGRGGGFIPPLPFIAWNGVAGDRTGTVGVPVTPFNTSTHFSHSGGTPVYSAVGTWPAGVTIDPVTGIIAGTPAAGSAGVYPGLKVRGAVGPAYAVSNPFTYTIAAP
jgi:hypothetical protein